MIVSNEHKEDLITIAKKLERKPQSYPQDENGSPTETYLEYMSLMYKPEITKIVIELPVFPETISIIRLAKKLNMDKLELMKKLEEASKRGFILKLGKSYSQLMPLNAPILYCYSFVNFSACGKWCVSVTNGQQ